MIKAQKIYSSKIFIIKYLRMRGKHMDIFVCIKQVPGTSKVEVDPVTGVLKEMALIQK